MDFSPIYDVIDNLYDVVDNGDGTISLVLREKSAKQEKNSNTEIQQCIHEWKKYEGFTDVFYYCEKCDAKYR